MTAATIETKEMVPARDNGEWSVERIVEQTLKVKQCMNAVMKRDEHYGVIPGVKGRKDPDTNKEIPPKPTLLKPGAEKLCLLFRLCPDYETLTVTQSRELVSYTVRCVLTHIPTGNRVATGLGSCNSREAKYVRPGDRKCPSCGKETIIKGKEEYGGGWLCFTKKGGCNAKFKDDDVSITGQDLKPADPSDLDNTILKMACKRALVAAVLNGTAASDCFTQDMEDLVEKAAEYAPPAERERPLASTGTPTTGQPPPVASTHGTRKAAPKASDIPHEGRNATAAQLGALVELKKQVGGLTDHLFQQQVQAFRAPDGKTRITKPEHLSVKQMELLLDRYKAKIVQQHANLADSVESIGQVIGKAQAVSLQDAMQKTFVSDLEESEWCMEVFGVDSVKYLDKETSAAALQLVLAKAAGEETYKRALAEYRNEA